MPDAGPIEVFISYAHKDERLMKKLRTHLAMLRRQGVIADWHDRDITAGDEWKGQIDTHLKRARVVLLLVSPDFIASDYCYDVELKRAMSRHKSGRAVVIPVFLRPCDWNGAPFGKVQGLPTDAEPVTSRRWSSQDEALTVVAQGIRAAIKKHRDGWQGSTPAPAPTAHKTAPTKRSEPSPDPGPRRSGLSPERRTRRTKSVRRPAPRVGPARQPPGLSRTRGRGCCWGIACSAAGA